MKVTWKGLRKFAALKCGDVFEADNYLFMKTTNSLNTGRAIRLDSGVLLTFKEDYWVRPVNAFVEVQE